ncbi:MAG TPA: UPF0280 family protein [Roseiarcus sp.]|jgi:ApbE superfamily uncharacterized protein (UPF0280 family)
MREPPQHRRLSDGRLHLNDGPIDLIIEAFGAEVEIERAYQAAGLRFQTLLDELCSELPLLRTQATANSLHPKGSVARRMADAVAPFAPEAYITPMAAVAGSVAEEILEAMTKAATLNRAYVNNGGDIALHLLPGERFRVAIIDRPDQAGAFGRAEITGDSDVRGVATSGRHGRSFSLGIADAVTVLAASASAADAAATIVANAVDLPGHPAIRRAPANAFDLQSDLGEKLVTRDVASLNADEVDAALARGWREAERLRQAGRIVAAALHLQGETFVCGALSTLSCAPAKLSPPEDFPSCPALIFASAS